MIAIAGCDRASTEAMPTSNADSSRGAVSSEDSLATQAAMADFLEACLKESGFETVRDGPAVGVRVAPAQQEQYSKMLEECSVEMHDRFPDPPLLRGSAFYNALVEAQKCLADLGFNFTSPPTLDSFLDDLDSGRPPWSPFLELPPWVVGDEWERVNQTCPQPAGA